MNITGKTKDETLIYLITPCAQHLPRQPRFSIEFDKRSFSYLSPNIWNNLPLEMRPSPTLNALKRLSNLPTSNVLCPTFHPHSSSDCHRIRFSLYAHIACLRNLHIINYYYYCVEKDLYRFQDVASKRRDYHWYILQALMAENCFTMLTEMTTRGLLHRLKMS